MRFVEPCVFFSLSLPSSLSLGLLSLAQAERRVFTNFHRQVFCWLDQWYGLTMDDIRRIEDETRQALDEVCVCVCVYVSRMLGSWLDC